MHHRLLVAALPFQDHIVLGVGRGFEIAQKRLGPGRLHHCMRMIGSGERSLALMIERAAQRTAFKRQLIAFDTVQQDIANSRIRIQASRQSVAAACALLDEVYEARKSGKVGSGRGACPARVCMRCDRAQSTADVLEFSFSFSVFSLSLSLSLSLVPRASDAAQPQGRPCVCGHRQSRRSA